MNRHPDHHGSAEHPHGRVAAVLRALGDPSRLSLVHCLSDGEHRVGDLAQELGLAQSTVSEHVRVLRDAGLVSGRAEGRSTYYRLTSARLDDLLHLAESFVAP